MTEICCGLTQNIRSTALTSLVHYETDRRHAGCDRIEFDADSVITTTSGEWQVEIDGNRMRVDSSSLVVGNAGDSYRCRHARRSGEQLLTAVLKPGTLDPGSKLFENPVVEASGTARLFARAAQAATDDEFDTILFTIFSEASTASMPDQNTAFRMRIQRAKRFIELHAFEAITLTDLAGELALSPFTTIRQFKAATGKTPHCYMLDVRLNAAKKLLLKTSAPVEWVAKTVGFDDLAYFSRFFKRRTGITPSGFRVA